MSNLFGIKCSVRDKNLDFFLKLNTFIFDVLFNIIIISLFAFMLFEVVIKRSASLFLFVLNRSVLIFSNSNDTSSL